MEGTALLLRGWTARLHVLPKTRRRPAMPRGLPKGFAMFVEDGCFHAPEPGDAGLAWVALEPPQEPETGPPMQH